MKKCTVYFDSDLSNDELQKLLEAFRLFKKVASVEMANPSESPSYEQIGNSNLESTIKEQESYKQVENEIKPATEDQMFYKQTDQSESKSANFQTSFSQDNSSSNHIQTQKKIIGEAIKWGLRNQKISLNDLKNNPPEYALEIAKKLIKMMPDAEKEKLLKISAV